MSRLNKKILREIKLNKMQFFNIFIMVFLGVFVFEGVHAYMDGMKLVEINTMKATICKISGFQEKTLQMKI